MKIFISHNSRQKPLVREIRNKFPKHITTWLDEDNLLIGDNLSKKLEAAIKLEVDYVLLFIDDYAAKSEWVKSELEWAIKKELEIKRTFLLLIVIDDFNIEEELPQLSQRKYLKIADYSEQSVHNTANEISSSLFALICRDLERFQNPKYVNASKTIDDAEILLSDMASLIRKAVFPHRLDNPITVEKLHEVINFQLEEPISSKEFIEMLELIAQRNYIPGLSYDGYEIYLVEEHTLWKSKFNNEEKIKVARKAGSVIKNGMKVYIDAGSTTEEMVKILCKKIETRAISKITIATPSVNHADIISDCCVEMGFDDSFSAVELFVPGGQIRPGTQAIIPLKKEKNQIKRIATYLGGFDLCILGVNGIHKENGLTTHNNIEAEGKQIALKSSKACLFVCDDSKCGITLDFKIADFTDNIKIIFNKNESNKHSTDLSEIYAEKIITV